MRIFCRKICNGKLIITARRGDEEVNKRIKQKNIYLNKLPNISVSKKKQTFFRGQKKNENKTKSS